MAIIRGIPDRYLSIACTVLSFVLFYAGGTAFSQSAFYGSIFIVLAIILFFMAIRFGKKIPHNK